MTTQQFPEAMDFDRTESIRSFLARLLTRYAGELEPLFRQCGIPYARGAGPESATLVLGPGPPHLGLCPGRAARYHQLFAFPSSRHP